MLTVSTKEKEKITSVIRRKYSRVAQSLADQFRYPTGRAGLQQLGYPEELMEVLPDEVAQWYCGVGNPLSLSDLMPGESVLDLGCGAGVDTILAARLVEPTGFAIGVDLSDEMIERAENNKLVSETDNVTFQVADTENLPFGDGHFDVVISNAMLNLAVEKEQVLREAHRVLKKDGRIQIADQILVGDLMDQKQALESWFK